jgi:hypothetical protein
MLQYDQGPKWAEYRARRQAARAREHERRARAAAIRAGLAWAALFALAVGLFSILAAILH